MKILLVIEAAGGGSGLHVVDLARGLCAQGHAVSVFYATARAEPSFVAGLEELPLTHLKGLEMARAVGPADLGAYLRLKKAVQERGPFDVIHAHSSKAGALSRALPRRLAKAFCYTPHAFRTMDPTMGKAGAFVYGTIEKILGRLRTDALIPVSVAEENHANNRGIAPSHTYLVVNGVANFNPLPRAEARAQMGVAEGEFVAGFIGRLCPQKDPVRFVKAVGLARKSAPNIRGVVIGDGELRAEAEAANTTKAATFLGWQDAPALLSGFDCLVMTSAYEAMPYTLLEALHAHLSIISSHVGGTEETLIDGENGMLLANDATPDSFANAIVSLASDEAKRAAFAAASAKLAESRTADKMVEATLTVYEKAMANRRN